eukprot:CAMPEP_0170643714 /NCGR_PEP_ID=MMETSP0224-20130122/42050_1 /TAXON_ID=285029 /ORGANISM="Togula jolla, Strain CCCM 725" /LENGTH=36 /DNA_ID= /DNA_START= /DNA_END= /DNA_ORIENTATION=
MPRRIAMTEEKRSMESIRQQLCEASGCFSMQTLEIG